MIKWIKNSGHGYAKAIAHFCLLNREVYDYKY